MKKKPWKRLSQSDSEAVMRLVDEYQSSIKRIIVSVLKGQWPDAVDDILQDTYEEICRQLNLIEEAENRRAYVCKIAARLAIQAHRRLGRDLPLDEDVPAPEDLSFNLDTILPCSLSPSDKRLLKRVYEEQDNIFHAGEFILAPLRKKAEELNCILCEPKYSATEGALMLAMERFPLSPS